jgi:hypothetical protein
MDCPGSARLDTHLTEALSFSSDNLTDNYPTVGTIGHFAVVFRQYGWRSTLKLDPEMSQHEQTEKRAAKTLG